LSHHIQSSFQIVLLLACLGDFLVNLSHSRGGHPLVVDSHCLSSECLGFMFSNHMQGPHVLQALVLSLSVLHSQILCIHDLALVLLGGDVVLP
jgi:hypothetical protein